MDSNKAPNDDEQLLAALYDELRRVARQKLAKEAPGQTLNATDLVHEAYLRLAVPGQPSSWENRAHFFAAAAEAMRRILVERARRKQRLKHGAGAARAELDEADAIEQPPSEKLLAVDEALDRLDDEQPEKARLVKLRYFAGFTIEEAADLLGISRTTAHRHWTYARAWLHQELN